MQRDYEFKLTRAEMIEAVNLFLDKRGAHLASPSGATTPANTQIAIQHHVSGKKEKIYVKQGQPLRVFWSEMDGEEP